MDKLGSRICLYLVAMTFVSLIAGGIGQGRWDSACEADLEATDCDLGGLYFIWWAFVAFAICGAAAVVLELVLTSRRARR